MSSDRGIGSAVVAASLWSEASKCVEAGKTMLVFTWKQTVEMTKQGKVAHKKRYVCVPPLEVPGGSVKDGSGFDWVDFIECALTDFQKPHLQSVIGADLDAGGHGCFPADLLTVKGLYSAWEDKNSGKVTEATQVDDWFELAGGFGSWLLGHLCEKAGLGKAGQSDAAADAILKKATQTCNRIRIMLGSLVKKDSSLAEPIVDQLLSFLRLSELELDAVGRFIIRSLENRKQEYLDAADLLADMMAELTGEDDDVSEDAEDGETP